MNNLCFVRDIMTEVRASGDQSSDVTSCVLGVLSTHMGEETQPFPSGDQGRKLLLDLGVPAQYARQLAYDIIVANDAYEFRRAWRLLDIAHKLVYREFRRKHRRKPRPWISWAKWAGEDGFVPAKEAAVDQPCNG